MASEFDSTDLRRALDDLRHGQDSLRSAVHEVGEQADGISSEVADVAKELDSALSELGSFRRQFDHFVEQNERTQNMVVALLEMSGIRQEMSERLGYRDEIRRLARGVLAAMESGTVTHESIQTLSEQKMLTAPDYWLASAIVGLAAWIRDDKVLAVRALETALTNDYRKTALLYTLVLARQQRDDATAKWLRQALRGYDRLELPREFTVIIDAAVNDILGKVARPHVVELMESWIESLGHDERVVADQTDRWRALLSTMGTPVGASFPTLQEMSSTETCSALDTVLEDATVFAPARAHFEELAHRAIELRVELRQQVSEIIDNLVERYDEEEAAYRRQLQRLQAIVVEGGDKDAAAAAVAAAEPDDRKTVDFLTLISDAALGQTGVSDATQRICFLSAKGWIQKAAADLADDIGYRIPRVVDLKFGPWTGHVSWDQTSITGVVEEARRKIARVTEENVAAVRFGWPGLLTSTSAGLGLVMAVVLALQAAAWQVTSGALAVGLVLLWHTTARFQGLQPHREELQRWGAQLGAAVEPKVAQAFQEIVEWRELYKAEISHAASLIDYLGTLPGASLYQRDVIPLMPRLARSQPAEPDRVVVAMERAGRSPNTDSSGRPVALRPPDWDLEPPATGFFRTQQRSG